MRIALRVMASLLALGLFLVSIHIFRRPSDPAFEGRYCSQWTADLLSPEYKTRTEAQAALMRLGEAAVPQLRRFLEKRNHSWEPALVRLNAWLPFLNYHAVDANLCRQRGAEMAGLLGSRAAGAMPALIRCLAFDSTASEAERALLRCRDVSLPHIESALTHRKPEIRARAAKLLREFSRLPGFAVQKLVRVTRDRNANVRRESAQTLGEVAQASDGNGVTDALLGLTRDEVAEVRAAALEALGKRLEEPGVAATVRASLSDPAVMVRLHAAKTLWLLRQDSAAVLPVLTAILKTRESWRAAYALAEMGDAAAPAIPGLIEALRREKVPRPFRTRPSCAFALGQIGAPAIPALDPLLSAPDARTRLNAVLAIGFMGKRGYPAVPELLPLLDDHDAEVRHATALTLATIGAGRDQVLAGLSACLSAEDIYMRSAAAQVLREIAPEQNWIVQPE